MAALPASFLNPGTSLAVRVTNSTSGLHSRADLYIGQKAVLALTIAGGPAGSFAAADSRLADGWVDGEQLARSSTATAIALTAHCLSTVLIVVLHLLPSSRSAGEGARFFCPQYGVS